MKSNLSEWVRSNAFSILNVVVVIAGFAYTQGAQNAKFTMLEDRQATAEKQNDDRMTAAQKKIDEMDKHGNLGHEARIGVLEKKTDDLAVLKNIVQTQSESIRQLTETVRSDHDILIRYVTAAEQKK